MTLIEVVKAFDKLRAVFPVARVTVAGWNGYAGGYEVTVRVARYGKPEYGYRVVIRDNRPEAVLYDVEYAARMIAVGLLNMEYA